MYPLRNGRKTVMLGILLFVLVVVFDGDRGCGLCRSTETVVFSSSAMLLLLFRRCVLGDKRGTIVVRDIIITTTARGHPVHKSTKALLRFPRSCPDAQFGTPPSSIHHTTGRWARRLDRRIRIGAVESTILLHFGKEGGGVRSRESSRRDVVMYLFVNQLY